jgi:hypothetical protein
MPRVDPVIRSPPCLRVGPICLNGVVCTGWRLSQGGLHVASQPIAKKICIAGWGTDRERFGGTGSRVADLVGLFSSVSIDIRVQVA